MLGPEAPLIALGLGLSAVAVGLFRVEAGEARLLGIAGAFAAIAAAIGALVGVAFPEPALTQSTSSPHD